MAGSLLCISSSYNTGKKRKKTLSAEYNPTNKKLKIFSTVLQRFKANTTVNIVFFCIYKNVNNKGLMDKKKPNKNEIQFKRNFNVY